MTGKEATVINISKEAGALASWPTHERLRALKRIIPRASVEDALALSRQKCSYCSRVPDWFMVWFVIALGLFGLDCYRQVFRWLQSFRGTGAPGRSTLCEARKRVGVAPFRHLANQVIRLLGKPATPGAFYRRMRTMALDGFIVDVPDSPANERAFGRPKCGRGPAAFPQARVLALCETGSHVMWRFLIKPQRCGEITMAHYLLRSLQKNMLLLWDRSFLSYETLTEVIGRQAQLLARIKSNLVFKPIRALDDGSYLSKMYRSPADRIKDRNGIVVRIIEYIFNDPGRPGSGEVHRLLTTLLDDKLDPAQTMIVLYHERWEEELAIDELKTHQRERRVLRSQTPAGVVQELYGLLIGHFVIRSLMQTAAAEEAIDPRRLSFTGTLKVLRCRLPECPASRRGRSQWYANLVAEISEEKLEDRRNRINPRVIKRQVSKWPKKKAKHCKNPQPEKQFCDGIVMLR
jgi:hypothetical protein